MAHGGAAVDVNTEALDCGAALREIELVHALATGTARYLGVGILVVGVAARVAATVTVVGAVSGAAGEAVAPFGFGGGLGSGAGGGGWGRGWEEGGGAKIARK
jgi:hypothetical protein